jgi:hypothetical protein
VPADAAVVVPASQGSRRRCGRRSGTTRQRDTRKGTTRLASADAMQRRGTAAMGSSNGALLRVVHGERKRAERERWIVRGRRAGALLLHNVHDDAWT